VTRRLPAALVGTAIALAGLLLAVPAPAAAAASCYADSVDRALVLLRDARADDRDAARRAATELETCTGQSQREILADLNRDPPDVPDARDRLAALSRAARSPAFVPSPGRAQQAIRDILAQPRYAAIRQGPSLGDRIRDLLLRLLVWLFEGLGQVLSGPAFGPLAVLAALVLLGVAVVVVRGFRWGGRREARLAAAAAGAEARARDRFLEADRLAAAGDLEAAVRALAGAVAAALGDDRTWERSPLTVRELFAGAPDPDALRPLLVAFELTVYGGRPPSPAAYERAAAAAARFRPPAVGVAA
jgi:hypothetical protein